MSTHISDVLYSIPKLVSGSELSAVEMLAIATLRYPNKTYVILRHWMIIDIVGAELALQEIKRTKKNPTVVYYSLADNTPSRLLKEDSQSCSDYQISYNDGFFETEETVYLLMGKGFRKTASTHLASLFSSRLR